MCGIAGIVRLDGGGVELPRLQAMNSAMRYRGPDGEGTGRQTAKSVSLIIDLATGDQLMANEAKTIQLIFNGEIYYFMDLN